MKLRPCLLSLLILVLAAACTPLPGTDAPLPSTPAPAPAAPTFPGPELILMQAGYGMHGSWYELYFTDPASPYAAQNTGGPDLALAHALDNARMSVDMAVYSLSLPSIRDALIRAHRRGVAVRIVMESDNRDRSAPQALMDAGITVLGDRREGLMHNKFVVIDRSEVWMGSMNFTTSGTYDDNNNLMRIRSTRIAENYAVEFDEMFVQDKFGSNTVPATPNPLVLINNVEVETYFSPDDGAVVRLQELLYSAESSIHFLAYSFTSDPLGEVIRLKASQGVTVAGVMESEQVASNQGTEYDPFALAGLDVRKDGNRGQMHHKVIIIDEEIVITGSYNFSNSAEERNDENIIIIHSQELASQFMGEFERVYRQAGTP